MAESAAAAPVTALAVISGPLPEKVQAFNQIASAAASLMFPGGYDSPPKVMAACWGADALGVHPVTFMNGCHVMQIKGRTVLEPKWDFMLALVRSRLPGFRYKVEVETAEACRIWISDGALEHTISYTADDADRQGHTTGANAETWRKNKKEMLFKSCMKRGLRRVAAHILAGLPPGLDDYESAGGEATAPGAAPGSEAKPPAKSAGAQGADHAPQVDVQTPAPARPASGAEEVTAHTALSLLLDDLYGAKLSRAKRLEKCGLVMGLIHGGPARVYKRADEIGPADAQAIYAYLIQRYPERKPVVGGEGAGVRGDAPAEPKPPTGQDDDAPPTGTGWENEIDLPPNDMGTWTGFMTLVLRCRKEMQREVLGKGIKDERKLYVIDLDILNAAGVGNAAVLVRDAEGTVMVPPDQLRAFSYAMSALLERNAKPEYAR